MNKELKKSFNSILKGFRQKMDDRTYDAIPITTTELSFSGYNDPITINYSTSPAYYKLENYRVIQVRYLVKSHPHIVNISAGDCVDNTGVVTNTTTVVLGVNSFATLETSVNFKDNTMELTFIAGNTLVGSDVVVNGIYGKGIIDISLPQSYELD